MEDSQNALRRVEVPWARPVPTPGARERPRTSEPVPAEPVMVRTKWSKKEHRVKPIEPTRLEPYSENPAGTGHWAPKSLTREQ